ncbi:T9SS type A sorting domain-containing protein, partial [bacterium]|nr:T9SS type A sorting domain-containing protein [bacterium]
GLYIDSGDILIENSLIANNTARGTAPGGMQGNSGYAYGGAIDIENGEIIIKNSIIGSNIATSSHGTRGSGVHCANGVIAMENNTFAYNNTVAVYNTNASVRIFNTIIYFNNDNNEQLQGEFSVSYSDILGGYEGIGNINMNPVMQQLGDFHIIVEGSPCIDVGNPDPTYNDTCFPPSLGSERNDIGAHGGPGGCDWQSLNEVIEIQSQIPESYIMAQNYPNPFNSKTIIAYHLPASGVVNLTIYNILGKEIKQLVYQYQLSGNHKVIWDGSDRNGSTVSSGIYYYLIKSRDLLESNKMVLLR